VATLILNIGISNGNVRELISSFKNVTSSLPAFVHTKIFLGFFFYQISYNWVVNRLCVGLACY